jgi:hypothetical protein
MAAQGMPYVGALLNALSARVLMQASMCAMSMCAMGSRIVRELSTGIVQSSMIQGVLKSY